MYENHEINIFWLCFLRSDGILYVPIHVYPGAHVCKDPHYTCVRGFLLRLEDIFSSWPGKG